MRTGLIAAAVAALVLAITPATAAPPDEAFSQAHIQYMQAKSAEFLAPITSKGGAPTGQQLTDAWCRAAYFWKMANPGGEAKLTLKVLLQFRRLQWMCGQKVKRAPPLPEENDEDGTPPPPPPTDSDPGDRSEGGDGAVEDFMRWHPEEFGDPTGMSEEDYIRRRLFWWEMLGAGGALSEAAAAEKKSMDDYFGSGEAERILGPDAQEQTRKAMEKNVAEAERKHGEAEDAEIAKARRAWAAANPGKEGDYDGDLHSPSDAPEQTSYGEWRYDPDDGQGPYALPFERLTPEQQTEHYEWERRTADGSLDPLDAATAPGSVDPLDPRWEQASQPIIVGPNSQVGSGAQVRDQVVGTIAGALLPGGRDNDGDSGPPVESCRPPVMQSFGDPQTGVVLEVSARRNRNGLVVFARVANSPDHGTFQTAFLQDQQGQQLAPRDVDICRLYGQWRLSVGWSRSTYQNGALTNRETGGWQQQGEGMMPGLPGGQGGQPDGLWRRLGFNNASRGAQMVAVRFDVAPGQLNGQSCLVIHITRPGQNPVTTAPFVLVVREGPEGISFERMTRPAG